MQPAKRGDRVRVHYTGRLEDGTVFDSTLLGDPVEVTAGDDEFLTGVGEAVVGMRQGESKTITVTPGRAYGRRWSGVERRVPRAAIPSEARVGDVLRPKTGDPDANLWIVELHDEYAILDPRTPLSDHTLVFEIKVVTVESQAN